MNKDIDPITLDLLAEVGAHKFVIQVLLLELCERDLEAAKRMLGKLKKSAAAAIQPEVAIELERILSVFQQMISAQAADDDESL